MSEPKPKDKPFAISKWVVWEAYQRVKANDGAAGVDGESIEAFERDLKGNLYKLWNRLSSGSYLPSPVRAVEIPKKHGQGKVRVLGVPTVADRVAQTVVRLYLEPKVEPLFHPDSYGYRAGRSALQAVGVCRERCWRRNWVIDLDIRAFFDSVPHELVLRAVRRHTRRAMDPAVRGALAERPAPAGGWHAHAERSRYASGLIDLTVASQSLLALHVRRVDGEALSGSAVRTILR
jgi:RNA-directed DNA polymerase